MGTVDRYGTCFSSGMARASRSARSATRGPLPVPTSAHRPVPEDMMRGRRPAAIRRCATLAVVRRSACAISGWACRSRRKSISSCAWPARNSPRSTGRLAAGMRRLPRAGGRDRGEPGAPDPGAGHHVHALLELSPARRGCGCPPPAGAPVDDRPARSEPRAAPTPHRARCGSAPGNAADACAGTAIGESTAPVTELPCGTHALRRACSGDAAASVDDFQHCAEWPPSLRPGDCRGAFRRRSVSYRARYMIRWSCAIVAVGANPGHLLPHPAQVR